MNKPPLTIDLIAPEGNAYTMVAMAQNALTAFHMDEQAGKLGIQFWSLRRTLRPPTPDIHALVEEYCTVTRLNEHIRLKEALVNTQENATELADTLELLRTDIKEHHHKQAAKLLSR